jgi:hypothetical protein
VSAVHSHAWRYAKVVAESGGKRRALSEEEKARNPDVVHPVIRPHPKTGRPCLYVNEGYTARLADPDPLAATRCCNGCSRTRPNRASPIATAGGATTSWSGTTASSSIAQRAATTRRTRA